MHFSYFSTNFYLFSKFTGFKTKLKGSFIKSPWNLAGTPWKDLNLCNRVPGRSHLQPRRRSADSGEHARRGMGEGVEGTQEIELYLWVVAAWAGMACSGGSTASRGWRRGRYGGGGVPAGLRWVGRGSGRRREVGGARGRRVDLARWVEQGTAAAPGADEKPSVRGRAKEEGNIWGVFCPG